MKQLASLLSVWSFICCCFQENLVQSLVPKCASDQMTVQWPNGTFKQCLHCAECQPGHGLYPDKCGDIVKYPVKTHECKKCESGKTFSDTYDTSGCKLCHSCAEHEVVTKKCTLSSDTKCNKTCNSGYFFSKPQHVCKRCSYCCLDGKDEEQPQCINQGLKAFNRYCSPRPDSTCTPTQTPTESRSHGKIEWILLSVGIGLLFGVILYCLWRKHRKKRGQDGCNLRVAYEPSEDESARVAMPAENKDCEDDTSDKIDGEGAQGGRERKGSFSDHFQSLRRNYSNTSSNYESLSEEGPDQQVEADESSGLAMPAENKDCEDDVFDKIDEDESARVTMPAENKDGKDNVSDNIVGKDFVVICLITGAQGGRERKGSFSGRIQSFRRKLSNTSTDYEPLSGEDPDQSVEADESAMLAENKDVEDDVFDNIVGEVLASVHQRTRSRTNTVLPLRTPSIHAIKEENTDQPSGQSWPPKEVAIKLSPDSPEIQAGSRVEFRCEVNGCQQVLYRWFKDEQELPGGNNSTLILDPLKMQDFGSYRCEVRSDERDDVRCVESNVVELDVTPAGGKSYRKLSEVFYRDLDLKETVANLLEKEITVCRKAYKHVAFHYKMTDIDRLERCKNPGEGVLDYLKSAQPDLTVYHFCKVLKGETIRRLDIVYKLVDYLI
ncbi:uncharacterized protein [Acropora muricata]|uniref:uncharacterized protein isoform X2 n=1 Tax=Acropora muricata TaxID=159855 RepID=UPI0034E37A84